MLSALEDPVELWDSLKCETLDNAKRCVGGHLRSQGGFTSVVMLDSIEKNHIPWLVENRDQYKALSRRTGILFEEREGEVCQDSRGGC